MDEEPGEEPGDEPEDEDGDDGDSDTPDAVPPGAESPGGVRPPMSPPGGRPPRPVGGGEDREDPGPPDSEAGPATEGPEALPPAGEPTPEDEGGNDEPAPAPPPPPPAAPGAPPGLGAPSGGPPSGLGGSTLGRRRGSGVKGLSRWEFWWEYNKDRFLRRIPVGIATGSPHRGPRVDRRERIRREVLLPALKTAASDRQPTIRAGAMLALGKVGDLGSFSLLYRGVKDESAEVRMAALLGLAYLGCEDVAPVLQKTVLDGREKSKVRAFAAGGLGLLGEESSTPFLAGLIADRREPLDVRAAAVLALGLLPGEGARDALLRTLSDPRESQPLRALAANALGRQKTMDNVTPLLNALRDRSVEVRRSAALGLGAVHYVGRAEELHARAEQMRGMCRDNDTLTPDARDDLDETIDEMERLARRERKRVHSIRRAAIRRLLTAVEKDSDLQTQAFALMSLGEIGADEGLRPVLKILDRKTHRLKPWAALSAGVSGKKGFAPLLKRSFHRKGEDPSVRAAMAIGLGLLRERSFAPDLTRVALDAGEDPDFRGYAVMALGMMWDPRAHDALEKILETKGNPALHRSAAIALGITGRSDSGARLLALMENTNDLWVKAAATIALGYLRDTRNAQALAREAADPTKPFLSRLYSVLAVGYVGDRSAAPPKLSELAWHHNYRVRIPAVDSLTSLL